MCRADDGKGNSLWGRPDPEVALEMIPSPILIPKFLQPEHKTIFRTSLNQLRTMRIKEGA